MSGARNAGESAICPGPEQPSAEIVRVERAKCRRECDLSRSRATLCGDRARRMREMQARVRFVPVRSNPLRRSCVSRERNAGKSATCPGPAQPSAEIVRVDFVVYNCSTRSNLWSWKLRTGDFVVQLEYAEYLWSWKMRTGDFLGTTLSGELEDENWRLCSTTLVRGATCGAGS